MSQPHEMRPVLQQLLGRLGAAFLEAAQEAITTPEAMAALFAQLRPIIQRDPNQPKVVIEYIDSCWTVLMEKLLSEVATGALQEGTTTPAMKEPPP